MSGFHDDILKKLAKSIRLQSNLQQKKPIIHIKINLDKCYQLFEHEGIVRIGRNGQLNDYWLPRNLGLYDEQHPKKMLLCS